ncbi:MAG: HAD family hydrolase [Clostridia bacterium]|nr:HAD family hydrolase [Clostridia bacterium]
MKNYKVILFDLDGTVSDSGRGITNSVKYALKKFGIEETDYEKLKRFVGPPLYASFEKYYGFTHEEAVKAVEYYREYYNAGGIFELEIYDGIIDLLKYLKKSGKKVILATSKPEIYAEKIAEHFGFREYFDNISGALLDGSRIEKSDIIAYALRKIGSPDIASCIMIGDTAFDVIGANAFGMDSIAVTYGYGKKEDMEAAGATYIADTPYEIKKILKTD